MHFSTVGKRYRCILHRVAHIVLHCIPNCKHILRTIKAGMPWAETGLLYDEHTACPAGVYAILREPEPEARGSTILMPARRKGPGARCDRTV